MDLTWRDQELVIQPSDMALLNVAALARSGALDLSPRFQRRNRWERDRQSRLIESFLMNVPVPPVYLAEETRGRFAVIDGKQRLTAVVQFLNDEFKLTGLTFLRDLEGLSYGNLPDSITGTLAMRPLRAIAVMRQTADWVKYEVFLRLNTGGEPLNAQEVRNVAFAGQLNDAIIEGSAHGFLRNQLKIRGTSSAAYRDMSDVEFVLRFLALSESWPNFRGNLRAAMDNFMLEYHSVDSKKTQHFLDRYYRALEQCEAIWGTLAFRRFDGRQWRDQMIGGVYDAQMLAVDNLPDDVLERIRANPAQDVLNETARLFLDEEFDAAVRIATNTPSRVRHRVMATTEMLSRLAGA